MTTYNITVTNTWTQLATTSDTDLLVLWCWSSVPISP